MTVKGEQTRERILSRATDLMVRQGFGATSIRDLLEAAGITKGTLYFHFPGKDDLGIAVLERARDQFLAFVRKSLAGKTPRRRLEGHFRAVLWTHRAAGYTGGCLWGNTALEMSDAAGGGRYLETVSQVFAAWTAMVKQVIAEGQRLGEIRSDVRAGDLATHVVAAIEGGVMLSRLRKDPASLKGTLTSLRQMLGPRPAATRPGAGGRRLEGAGR